MAALLWLWGANGLFCLWLGARLLWKGRYLAVSLSSVIRGSERVWLIILYGLSLLSLTSGIGQLYLVISWYNK